jgi:hypothetical protein
VVGLLLFSELSLYRSLRHEAESLDGIPEAVR